MESIHMEFRFITDSNEVLASGRIDDMANHNPKYPENEIFIRNLLVIVGICRDKAIVMMGD